MAKVYTRYAKEISSALFYAATWTPGTPLRLGQIGTFEGGVFVPKAHLGAVGIAFEVEKDPNPKAYTYASKKGVSLRFKAKGEPAQPFKSLADVEAGVAISFSRENATVFSISNCYENRIANVIALQNELAQRVNNNMWREEWAVVTHLVEAGSGTIVISSSGNTSVELEANATVGQGPAKLADISSGVSLSYSDSMNQLIVANNGITPLFHTLRLKRGFWTGNPHPIFNKAAGVTRRAQQVDKDAFEIVDFESDSDSDFEEDEGSQ